MPTVLFIVASAAGSLAYDLIFQHGLRAWLLLMPHPAATFQLHLLGDAAVAVTALCAAVLLQAAPAHRAPRRWSACTCGLANGLLGSFAALPTARVLGVLAGEVALFGVAVVAYFIASRLGNTPTRK